MKKVAFFIYLITTTLLIGCKKETEETALYGNFYTYFYTLNKDGIISDTIHENEDFYWMYPVKNSNTKKVVISYTPPLMSYSIYKDDSLIGSAYDGMLFPQVMIKDTLNALEIVENKVSWLSSTSHTGLPQGVYKVTVRGIYYDEEMKNPTVTETSKSLTIVQ